MENKKIGARPSKRISCKNGLTYMPEKFSPKLKWANEKETVTVSMCGKFEIKRTFRKEYILRSNLRGRVGQYLTLTEAKNQAEFVV